MRTVVSIFLISITLSCFSLADAKSSNLSASSQSEAAQVAQKNYGGKVLKVEFLADKNPAEYRVKLLTNNGSVQIVTINASSKKGK
jgi:uncharacterized membrane protein YkoI